VIFFLYGIHYHIMNRNTEKNREIINPEGG
jgi:hypothetical protein